MVMEIEPKIRTDVPGPLSREYLGRQEEQESNARTYPRNLPIAVRRAYGSLIEDVDGNVYIDFLAGAGVLPFGHSHPELVKAVQDQLTEYVHGLDFPTPIKDEFTQLQLGMLPESMRGQMKIHYCGPTGANGVEAALKLAKIATGRSDIISFHGGFHGSTVGAMTVTGLVDAKEKVPNGMPGVHFFPFSHCGQCPLGLNPSNCDTNCATYLERVLTDPNGGIPRPAAVIVEMVQGEGGNIPATYTFVQRLREITRRLGIVMIVDEVQTGCGRTGSWFAFEQYDIEPDIIISSKALGGIGLPVAVILYNTKYDVWPPGAHIGTFRGNQLAFAAGVAAIKLGIRERILDNVRDRGNQLSKRLFALTENNPWVKEVRGRGLMWGIELAHPQTGATVGAYSKAVQSAALSHGLILERGGRDDSVLRLLPPLNITAELIDRAADVLTQAFAEADSLFAGGT